MSASMRVIKTENSQYPFRRESSGAQDWIIFRFSLCWHSAKGRNRKDVIRKQRSLCLDKSQRCRSLRFSPLWRRLAYKHPQSHQLNSLWMIYSRLLVALSPVSQLVGVAKISSRFFLDFNWTPYPLATTDYHNTRVRSLPFSLATSARQISGK